jgi:hypothetical protein
MSAKQQDKRQILADILSGKITPSAIPGQGCIVITPGANGLVDVENKLMNEKRARKAMSKAEYVLFFPGHHGTNDLYEKLSAEATYHIDFNEDKPFAVNND